MNFIFLILIVFLSHFSKALNILHSKQEVNKQETAKVVNNMLHDTQENLCPKYSPYCSCIYSDIIIQCKGFESFAQLNLKDGEFNELELTPSKPLVLDDSLKLENFKITQTVKLRNLAGFQFESNPFKSQTEKLDLFLYESKFDVYLMTNTGRELLNEEKCTNSSYQQSILENNRPLFTSFSSLTLDYGMDFSRPVCPYFFRDVQLRFIRIEYVKADNELNFIQVNKNMQSQIEKLEYYNCDLQVFDMKQFTPDVFGSLKELRFDFSILLDIENNLLSKFKSLKLITFMLANFDDFMNSAQKQWLNDLNIDVYVNLANQQEINEKKDQQMLIVFDDQFEPEESYDFNDAQLSTFKHFPHERLVFVKILTNRVLPCSETVKWLSKYWRNYKNPNELLTESVGKCLQSLLPSNSSKLNFSLSNIVTLFVATILYKLFC
jgi:hypothetical protein